MAKVKRFFVCQSCGHQATRWLGRCPDCQAWNTVLEERQQTSSRAPFAAGRAVPAPVLLAAVTRDDNERLTTCIGELDRVLGGGVVSGSLVLIGGDPGIGKSTLVLQAAAALSRQLAADPAGNTILYVAGEESAAQVKMRADRLALGSHQVHILTETSIALIHDQVTRLRPRALVVDSIQTMFSAEISSAPGSVSQVRECTAQLMALAKPLNLPVFIIGHVTKEGAIAGPRVLEHMVDTVLYFEGERHHVYRVLRAVKNRFGPTNEIGVFEMQQSGLLEVDNPSALFLAERPQEMSGSTVVASLEGSRPLLVELQALSSPAGFGAPRRVANGVEHQRLALLLAVLEKRLRIPMQEHDVYVNIVGGLRVDEPAIDLGIVMAVVSSLRDVPLDPQLVVFGEVGLTGEVRAVSQIEARLKEAAKLGFRRCLLPQANCQANLALDGMQLWGVRTVSEALDTMHPRPAITHLENEKKPLQMGTDLKSVPI